MTPDTRGGDVSGETGGAGPASSGGVGAGGNGTGGAGGTTGSAGAGGAGPTEPPIDIAGRWGMFNFEDPVGVQLKQAADGTLTGEGCPAGAPGSTNPPSTLAPFGCGTISGRVTGRTAWFALTLADFDFTYRMDVTVSTDGQRMAGTLRTHAEAAWEYPVALQRVRDEAEWLDRRPLAETNPIEGHYDLTLIPAASDGTEFVAGRTYAFAYWQARIYGNLGSFWQNEISLVNQGSPLRVGPVPATVPALPVSLTVDFTGAGIAGVTATTASGGHYQFSAKRTPAP